MLLYVYHSLTLSQVTHRHHTCHSGITTSSDAELTFPKVSTERLFLNVYQMSHIGISFLESQKDHFFSSFLPYVEEKSKSNGNIVVPEPLFFSFPLIFFGYCLGQPIQRKYRVQIESLIHQQLLD